MGKMNNCKTAFNSIMCISKNEIAKTKAKNKLITLLVGSVN